MSFWTSCGSMLPFLPIEQDRSRWYRLQADAMVRLIEDDLAQRDVFDEYLETDVKQQLSASFIVRTVHSQLSVS